MLAENQRDAPDTGNGDEYIDDARKHTRLPAADGGNQIIAENADKTPVECANHGEDQRDFINNHHSAFLSLALPRVV